MNKTRTYIICTLAIVLFVWPAITLATSRVRAVTPSALIIPKLGINATIEARGQSWSGRMLRPTMARRVAWYRDGTIPGQPGKAVMYGHLTDNSFHPAIFSQLNKLRRNDRVYVTDISGNTHVFRVTSRSTYRANEPPLRQIMGPTRYIQLNLYTCAGKWDAKTQNYTHYLVVYTAFVKSLAAKK